MTNYTPSSLPSTIAGEEHNGTYNKTVLANNNQGENDSGLVLEYILNTGYFLIIILGIWWNGTVIWLLGCCLKRTPFTTYILNLSIADFGLLTAMFIKRIFLVVVANSFTYYVSDMFLLIFLFMYSTGQFLLTAISMDRCVAVLFPLWHQCHRPPNMSATVCATIWGIFSISTAIIYTLSLAGINDYKIWSIQFIVSGFLCLPLMTISTVILFVKICFKSQQKKRGKILIIVLLALFFFIIFSFPLNAAFITSDILHSNLPPFFQHAFLYICLNSCINPLIYFLVGRHKTGRLGVKMKAILENAFKEEENLKEAVDAPVETWL